MAQYWLSPVTQPLQPPCCFTEAKRRHFIRGTGEGWTIKDPESEPNILHSQSVLKLQSRGGKNYGSSPSVRIPAVLYLLQRRTLLIHDLSDAALTNLPTRVQIYSRLQTAESQNSNSGATFYYIRRDRGRTRWFDLTTSRGLNGSMTDLMCSRQITLSPKRKML